MGNLLITIIAIALVAATATMGAYYGGNVLGRNKDRALASAISHQVVTIQSGITMYLEYNQGANVDSITMDDLLDGGHMSSIPTISGAEWTLDGLGNSSLQSAGSLEIEDDNDEGNICDNLLNKSDSWTCSTATGILYPLSAY